MNLQVDASKGLLTYSQVPHLMSTGHLGGEGVRESQDLAIRVGNLGQNQNDVLKNTFYLC